MTKIILETYVSKHKPPPDNTRPSIKLKEVNAIKQTRKEVLLQLLNELEKQYEKSEIEIIKKMREYILDMIEENNKEST